MDKRTGMKIGLLCVLLGVCSAVKIINLKVPSTYLLDQTSKTPDPLILDCEYEVDESEKGFVLKWLLDGQPVYQWIPSKNPFPFQSFKNRVDTSYVVSQEHLHKHRAMAIIKPLANFTGEYMCIVQTYASIDRKSAKLKIIVRESKFDLSYYLNGDGYITVDCHARDISPLPELQIRINYELFETENLKSVQGENGLYNVSISGRIRKDQLESPAMIECLLSIPETNYNKRRSTTYYESHLKTTTTTVATTTTVEMLQAAPENLQKKGKALAQAGLPLPGCCFFLLVSLFSCAFSSYTFAFQTC
uniref:Ig-like domain-containing protein n=1 Tax=Anopheles quadriannulatus TaxID=34691 RepID=A0A1I8JVN5_ANOQN